MTADPVLEIKVKARSTWAAGSYNDIAAFLPPTAHRLVEAAQVRSGQSVLDVATGTGVTAIAARRTGAQVVGLDLTPQLLSQAAAEADLAGVEGIEWREGDAEAMDFPDGTFDVVLSSFGHMFAPRPDVTIREMLRVLKPGGRIAFVTQKHGNVTHAFFNAMAKHVPATPNPPPSPFLWGDPAVVRERLGKAVKGMRVEDGAVVFPALSPGHYWRLFSTKYGPTIRAIESLGTDTSKHEAMKRDFVKAVAPFWSEGTVKMAYLLTTATKR
jgi:SAM-dependent methyltransferase